MGNVAMLVSLPVEVRERLEKEKEVSGVPMSRIIAMALTTRWGEKNAR
jgi:hypothetical protein